MSRYSEGLTVGAGIGLIVGILVSLATMGVMVYKIEKSVYASDWVFRGRQ